MKNKTNRGYFYQRTRVNAGAMLFWAAVLMVLFVLYMRSAAVYFPNATSTGHPLTGEQLAADSHMVTIEQESEPFDCAAYGVTTPPMLRLDAVYRRGSYYRFKLIPEGVREAGIGYSAGVGSVRRLVTARNGKFTEPVENRIMFLTFGGIEYPAIVPANITPEAGALSQKVVLIELPLYIGHDLGLTDAAGTEVGNWCFDLRYLSVDDEGSDFALILIFSILFPLFTAYSLLCFFKPKLHPNYLLLAHWCPEPESVIRELDDQLAADGVYQEKKLIYTEKYIIRETLYSTHVMKNHTYRH